MYLSDNKLIAYTAVLYTYKRVNILEFILLYCYIFQREFVVKMIEGR